jgi:cobyrinic acid a,c-diamide synthase
MMGIIKGLIVAGTHSGSGKTTVSLGLMAAFRRRGLVVSPFKVGPDFIDPGHHQSASGAVSRNLDGWMLSKEYNKNLFRKYAGHADIAVVEGVMGLFDGFSGTDEAGSTAQMAKWLSLPVVLVVDARSMARSAAALVYGFERFDPSLRFAGVIFNRIGSEKHMVYLREAISTKAGMPCLGGLPRNETIGIPERHLGLVTSEEHRLSDDYLDMLADLIEQNIDLDDLLDSLPEIVAGEGGANSPLSLNEGLFLPESRHRKRVRIGLARDKAFCFYYQDNLDLLEHYGAELVFFSPLKDPLPPRLDGLYLGGGYPELFVERLSDNQAFIEGVHRAGENGLPIYAECGGLMVLCRAIEDLDGKVHEMAGLYPFTVRRLSRLKALGYREIILNSPCPLGDAGEKARGHVFHYSEIIEKTDTVKAVYDISARSKSLDQCEGYLYRNVLAGYVHLHFGSNPDMARNFVRFCRKNLEEYI